VRCRTPASFRLRCSTASNSEEYEVESSADSKTLEPLRPGSTAVVPEPPSPLRSTSFPDRRGGFRSRSSPHTLELSAPGRTMMRRAGVTGCFTDPETSGSTRDPQLPWGSCCIRKTFWRLPVCYSNRHRHAHRSRKFSGVRDPVQTPGTVTRAARPSRVTGLSKSRLFGQQSRRFRPACPTGKKAYRRPGHQSTARFHRQTFSTAGVENMSDRVETRSNVLSATRRPSSKSAAPPQSPAIGARRTRCLETASERAAGKKIRKSVCPQRFAIAAGSARRSRHGDPWIGLTGGQHPYKMPPQRLAPLHLVVSAALAGRGL